MVYKRGGMRFNLSLAMDHETDTPFLVTTEPLNSQHFLPTGTQRLRHLPLAAAVVAVDTAVATKRTSKRTAPAPYPCTSAPPPEGFLSGGQRRQAARPKSEEAETERG